MVAAQVDLGPMRPEQSARLAELDSTLATIEKVMDPAALAERVRELEAQAGDPSLWDDPAHAQQVTSALSAAQAKIRKLESLRSRVDDMPVMFELAEEEGDTALADDELEDLGAAIEALEVTTMLSGEYDPREAVINIRSGAAWRRCRGLGGDAHAHVHPLGRKARPQGGRL